ncbi:hypothetical protein PMAYCL1PPCAC_21827, partial [Pristionchus mayeri]
MMPSSCWSRGTASSSRPRPTPTSSPCMRRSRPCTPATGGRPAFLGGKGIALGAIADALVGAGREDLAGMVQEMVEGSLASSTLKQYARAETIRRKFAVALDVAKNGPPS